MASNSERLLDGKVALITGTSRGIGRTLTEVFARHGAIVYAGARTEGCLDVQAEEWGRQFGTQVCPVYFDVTDGAGMRGAFMRIKKERQRLDVLVNNAGIMRDAVIGMVSNEILQDVFAVNVFAVAQAIQFAAKFMVPQKSGSIVNLASIVGVAGNEGQLAYSASKGAVIAMTKTAAKELAPHGVRVNAIAPGMIDAGVFQSIGAERARTFASRIGMGRLGRPEDVAHAAVFLASDMAAYVTGQILGVDGAAVV